ncbi:hypothetical protein ACRSRY_005903 [Klebsiella pneumoniae]
MLSKKVFFISQAEAERLEPVPGAAMISITDPDKSPAALGQWGQLYRDSFYDGGYSENTIHTMKAAFRMNYASYIDSSQAEKLSTFLDGLVGMEEELPLHLKIWDFLLVAVGLRR